MRRGVRLTRLLSVGSGIPSSLRHRGQELGETQGCAETWHCAAEVEQVPKAVPEENTKVLKTCLMPSSHERSNTEKHLCSPSLDFITHFTSCSRGNSAPPSCSRPAKTPSAFFSRLRCPGWLNPDLHEHRHTSTNTSRVKVNRIHSSTLIRVKSVASAVLTSWTWRSGPAGAAGSSMTSAGAPEHPWQARPQRRCYQTAASGENPTGIQTGDVVYGQVEEVE